MAKPVVAVIDGDPAIAMLMDDLLSDEGFQTYLWPEGQGAARFVRTLAPNLVILDLWLQERADGWGVLEALRHDPRTRSIPVIVCSGDTEMLQERHAELRAYGCGQLVKPFAVDDLLALVAAAAAAPTTLQLHVRQALSLSPPTGRRGGQRAAVSD